MSHRRESLVVLAVGGLSVATAALYVWAMQLAHVSGTGGMPAAIDVVAFAGANAASAGLLWWHRRHPVPVFAAILVVYVVSALLTGVRDNGGLTLPLWFSVFALAAYAPPLRAGIAFTVGWVAGSAVKVHLAVEAGFTATAWEVGLIFVVDVGFFYISCAALGLGFRAQRRRAAEAAERAHLIEERSRAMHAEAVATERNRLARELHDLAAHELMDVLLAVRALQIAGDDPTLPEIEQKTARALENMRTVVRTLREDEHDADPHRLPLSEAAAQVLATLRAERGIEVTSTIRVREPVADAVALTVLGVLQETVRNAARHAPGTPVTVTLDADATGVRLSVENPAAPSGTQRCDEGTGYGLIGAAERARLVGGVFDARPAANGDWIATLDLPSAAVTTATAPKEAAR